MHLLVMRHALAEDHRPDSDDALRALTKDGIRKARRVVRVLDDHGWRLDHVITSPWLRAAETAALLAPISAADPIESDLLTRSPSAELLARFTSSPSKKHATAVVGHQPWLSDLIAWLCFGDTRFGAALPLKKSGVAYLVGDPAPGRMQLRALLTPRLC